MYEQQHGVIVNFKELTAPVVTAGDVFFLEQELHESLLNLPLVIETDMPVTGESIHAHRLNDPQCQLRHRMNTEVYY